MLWLTLALGLACLGFALCWRIERKEARRLARLARTAAAEAEFCRQTVRLLNGSAVLFALGLAACGSPTAPEPPSVQIPVSVECTLTLLEDGTIVDSCQ